MKKICLFFLIILCMKTAESQTVIIFPTDEFIRMFIPEYGSEHGFLKGKKFQFYKTIGKYDFNSARIKVELTDKRDSLKLLNVNCSLVPLTNESEFVGNNGFITIYDYFKKIFYQSNIQFDTSSKNILKVDIEALDSRLIGKLKIAAHGLCQMRMNYNNISKEYCVDITDKDEHSPISSNAWVTRKTATRVIISAAIREVIEQFLQDLKTNTFSMESRKQ